MIAIRQRTKIRTLHQFGSCFRVPGRDYMDFIVHGPEVPDPSLFTFSRGDCFKNRRLPPRVTENSDASTGSSSSSDEEPGEQAAGAA